MLLLLLYVGIALGVSFLCSLLEASLLSVRVAELAGRKERGDHHAATLLVLKEERIDDAIGAILTLNTIAHTLGAALSGAQAADVFGDKWVGLFSGVLTLLILALTEILPKTIGNVYASHLVPFASVTLRVMTTAMRPILVPMRALTRLIGADEKRTPVSRGEVEAMVAIATEEGTLGKADSHLLTNVLRSYQVRVQDVMTPRTVIRMLPSSATLADLMADNDSRVFSRIPLFEGTRDDVLGWVLQRDALAAAVNGVALDTPLTAFLRPVLHIPEWELIGPVLRRMIEQREHVALATDEYGGISGLVTQEDLVETLLGVEIVDEYDRIEDLQAEARRLRDLRLQRLAQAAEDAELSVAPI